jgi:two-component system, response regulator
MALFPLTFQDEFHIVMADDDPDDRELMMEAVREMEQRISATLTLDGRMLLSYLEELLRRNVALPDLVVMDINMPRMNGKEALIAMKQHDALEKIPVAILTTSNDEQVKEDLTQLGACGFYTKPVEIDMYRSLIQQMLLECIPNVAARVKQND